MSQSTLSQIEESFSALPVSEQRILIDRLLRRVNQQTSEQNGNVDDQLAQMAGDPDIQREMRGKDYPRILLASFQKKQWSE